MIRNKVKYLRRSEGYDLTQEQLAVELGVSRQTIVELEKGRPPSAELLLKVSSYFNKDPRDIFFTDFVAYKTQDASEQVPIS